MSTETTDNNTAVADCNGNNDNNNGNESKCVKICKGLINLLNPIAWFNRMKTWGGKQWLKFFFVLFLVAFFVLAGVFSSVTERAFTGFLRWMENNLFIGSLAYIFIYTITTILLIPGSLLTLGAGFVFNAVLGTWGVFLATLVVMLGASSGATLSFILAKTLLRDTVEGLKEKYPSFATIDQVVEIYGLKVTFLLRLSPAIPFNAFNYLMGLTSVKLIDYVIALIGMIPGTIAYCFIGSTLGALAEASSVGFSDPTVLIFLIVGTTITIIGMIVLSIYAKKKYAELKEKVTAASKKDSMANSPREMSKQIGHDDTENKEGNNNNNNTTNDTTINITENNTTDNAELEKPEASSEVPMKFPESSEGPTEV